jgi:hypothetical protein
MTTIIFIRAKP